MCPNYVSESFWNASTIITLLMLLLVLVTMCIPAIVAYRYHDKKQMRISILCGVVSPSLLVPWIVSVVMVSKKYEMPKKKDSVVAPGLYTLCSLVLIGIGGAIMYRNYSVWGAFGGVSLLLWGVAFLVVSLLNGKGYWIGLMLMAPALGARLSTEYTETLYRIYETVAAAGALLILYNMFKIAVPAFTMQQTMETDSEEIPNAEQGGTEKMKLGRCQNGHFYDSAKYGDSCPYCAVTQQTDMTQEPESPVVSEEAVQETPITAPEEPKEAAPIAVPEEPKEEPVKAAPITAPEAPKEAVPAAAPKVPEKPKQPNPPVKVQEEKPEKKKQPVVGWLVCIRGVYRGESFTLKAGRNFIGRSFEMDVCLQEDNSIAEVKQAAIIYEPRSRQFIFMPGDVHELCYINNKVALSSASIGAYDVLEMGNTSLLLIPCCGEKFNWEDGLVK